MQGPAGSHGLNLLRSATPGETGGDAGGTRRCLIRPTSTWPVGHGQRVAAILARRKDQPR
jgi:hypothetical protein